MHSRQIMILRVLKYTFTPREKRGAGIFKSGYFILFALTIMRYVFCLHMYSVFVYWIPLYYRISNGENLEKATADDSKVF